MYALARLLCLIFLPVGVGLVAVVSATAANAQVGVPLGVYTLNQERLFADSLFGQRVRHEVETRSGIIAGENRRMEQELKDEEAQLTEKRPSLAPAEFRSLADAFDKKVESIRTGQAAKTRDLNKWSETERQRFFKAAFPVLLKLAQEVGASVILDQRSAIISSDQVDITDRAVKRMNETIADGKQNPQE